MKKSKRIISKILVFVIVIGMIFATGCSKKNDASTGNAESLVVTVGDQKVYLDEMMYYIFSMEANGEQYEQLYQQYYGTSYWDMEVEKGVTVRDQMKTYVMDTAVMYAILYDKAIAEGYKLTDDEKATAEKNADSLMTQMPAEQLKITGFTKESLIAVQEKLAVGERYYNDLIASFKIDDKAITATIDKDANRQYNTENLTVSTITYDKDYKQVALSDKEKAAAKEVINKALEEAKAGKTFADIAKELSTDKITVSTATVNFVKGDNKADAKYEEAALKLKKGAVSDGIIETDSAFNVIKMVDDNSTEAYDAAVKDAISKAENDAFTKKYEEIKKDYKVTQNDKVWAGIVMGKTTLITPTPAATTPEATTAPEATTTPEATKAPESK